MIDRRHCGLDWYVATPRWNENYRATLQRALETADEQHHDGVLEGDFIKALLELQSGALAAGTLTDGVLQAEFRLRNL